MPTEIKILIAEHDPTDLEMIHNELLSGGLKYITEVVQNERDFINSLETFIPDIILSDYTFPSFNGVAAFRIKEKMCPDTPFILVSGTIGEENSIELIKNGVTDFVLKDKIFTLNTKLVRALKEEEERRENRNAEKELKQSEGRLVIAQAIAKIGSWEIDLMELQVKWSAETYKIFEVNSHDCKITHAAFLQMIHPDDVEKVNLAFQNSFKRESVNTIEHRIITPTGVLKHVEECWHVNMDEQGNPISAVGTCQDITERKKAENEVKESEKRYRQIVETAQEGIWLIDQNNITTLVNKKMADILEYSPSEMMGKPHFFFMDDEWKHIAEGNIVDRKLGMNETQDFKYITRSGREVWTNLSTNPIFDDSGIYKGALAMVTDITQSKKAEKRDQFQATLLNTIGQAAIATDMEGNIIFWNKAASEMYGWTEEEVLDKNITQITPAQQTKEQADQIILELLQGNSWSGEFMVKRKDGSEFPAFVTNAPIYNQQQQLIGIIGVSTDITNRKQTEIRLKELNENLQKQAKELLLSNAELEQFAYVASHDLQEPLRMVTSFLTQLEKKYGGEIDEKGKKYIGFAVDGANRMRQIILDLLEFSKVGRMEDEMEELDQNELLKEIKILLRKKIEDKKAVIIIDQLPQMYTYRSPARQIFQNLISNALEYSRKDIPVQIYITVQDLKDHWQYAVIDNGIGIEKEYFDKIFIIFNRLHNRDEYSGTGMGLAITKKIIETQGGKIWVESEMDKGSTFYFTVPKIKV